MTERQADINLCGAFEPCPCLRWRSVCGCTPNRCEIRVAKASNNTGGLYATERCGLPAVARYTRSSVKQELICQRHVDGAGYVKPGTFKPI